MSAAPRWPAAAGIDVGSSIAPWTEDDDTLATLGSASAAEAVPQAHTPSHTFSTSSASPVARSLGGLRGSQNSTPRRPPRTVQFAAATSTHAEPARQPEVGAVDVNAAPVALPSPAPSPAPSPPNSARSAPNAASTTARRRPSIHQRRGGSTASSSAAIAGLADLEYKPRMHRMRIGEEDDSPSPPTLSAVSSTDTFLTGVEITEQTAAAATAAGSASKTQSRRASVSGSVIPEETAALSPSAASSSQPAAAADSTADDDDLSDFADWLTDEVPYKLQGDEYFYSASALAARGALVKHPRILRLIDQFWRSLRGLDMKFGLMRDEFVSLQVKMAKVIDPQWSLADAERIAVAEFQKEAGKSVGLSKEKFFRSVFEIVDTWTATIDAKDYIFFLDSLFKRLTVPKTKTVHELIGSTGQTASSTISYFEFRDLKDIRPWKDQPFFYQKEDKERYRKLQRMKKIGPVLPEEEEEEEEEELEAEEEVAEEAPSEAAPTAATDEQTTTVEQLDPAAAALASLSPTSSTVHLPVSLTGLSFLSSTEDWLPTRLTELDPEAAALLLSDDDADDMSEITDASNSDLEDATRGIIRAADEEEGWPSEPDSDANEPDANSQVATRADAAAVATKIPPPVPVSPLPVAAPPTPVVSDELPSFAVPESHRLLSLASDTAESIAEFPSWLLEMGGPKRALPPRQVDHTAAHDTASDLDNEPPAIPVAESSSSSTDTADDDAPDADAAISDSAPTTTTSGAATKKRRPKHRRSPTRTLHKEATKKATHRRTKSMAHREVEPKPIVHVQPSSPTPPPVVAPVVPPLAPPAPLAVLLAAPPAAAPAETSEQRRAREAAARRRRERKRIRAAQEERARLAEELRVTQELEARAAAEEAARRAALIIDGFADGDTRRSGAEDDDDTAVDEQLNDDDQTEAAILARLQQKRRAPNGLFSSTRVRPVRPGGHITGVGATAREDVSVTTMTLPVLARPANKSLRGADVLRAGGVASTFEDVAGRASASGDRRPAALRSAPRPSVFSLVPDLAGPAGDPNDPLRLMTALPFSSEDEEDAGGDARQRADFTVDAANSSSGFDSSALFADVSSAPSSVGGFIPFGERDRVRRGAANATLDPTSIGSAGRTFRRGQIQPSASQVQSTTTKRDSARKPSSPKRTKKRTKKHRSHVSVDIFAGLSMPVLPSMVPTTPTGGDASSSSRPASTTRGLTIFDPVDVPDLLPPPSLRTPRREIEYDADGNALVTEERDEDIDDDDADDPLRSSAEEDEDNFDELDRLAARMEEAIQAKAKATRASEPAANDESNEEVEPDADPDSSESGGLAAVAGSEEDKALVESLLADAHIDLSAADSESRASADATRHLTIVLPSPTARPVDWAPERAFQSPEMLAAIALQKERESDEGWQLAERRRIARLLGLDSSSSEEDDEDEARAVRRRLRRTIIPLIAQIKIKSAPKERRMIAFGRVASVVPSPSPRPRTTRSPSRIRRVSSSLPPRSQLQRELAELLDLEEAQFDTIAAALQGEAEARVFIQTIAEARAKGRADQSQQSQTQADGTIVMESPEEEPMTDTIATDSPMPVLELHANESQPELDAMQVDDQALSALLHADAAVPMQTELAPLSLDTHPALVTPDEHPPPQPQPSPSSTSTSLDAVVDHRFMSKSPVSMPRVASLDSRAVVKEGDALTSIEPTPPPTHSPPVQDAPPAAPAAAAAAAAADDAADEDDAPESSLSSPHWSETLDMWSPRTRSRLIRGGISSVEIQKAVEVAVALSLTDESAQPAAVPTAADDSSSLVMNARQAWILHQMRDGAAAASDRSRRRADARAARRLAAAEAERAESARLLREERERLEQLVDAEVLAQIALEERSLPPAKANESHVVTAQTDRRSTGDAQHAIPPVPVDSGDLAADAFDSDSSSSSLSSTLSSSDSPLCLPADLSLLPPPPTKTTTDQHRRRSVVHKSAPRPSELLAASAREQRERQAAQRASRRKERDERLALLAPKMQRRQKRQSASGGAAGPNTDDTLRSTSPPLDDGPLLPHRPRQTRASIAVFGVRNEPAPIPSKRRDADPDLADDPDARSSSDEEPPAVMVRRALRMGLTHRPAQPSHGSSTAMSSTNDEPSSSLSDLLITPATLSRATKQQATPPNHTDATDVTSSDADRHDVDQHQSIIILRNSADAHRRGRHQIAASQTGLQAIDASPSLRLSLGSIRASTAPLTQKYRSSSSALSARAPSSSPLGGDEQKEEQQPTRDRAVPPDASVDARGVNSTLAATRVVARQGDTTVVVRPAPHDATPVSGITVSVHRRPAVASQMREVQYQHESSLPTVHACADDDAPLSQPSLMVKSHPPTADSEVDVDVPSSGIVARNNLNGAGRRSTASGIAYTTVVRPLTTPYASRRDQLQSDSQQILRRDDAEDTKDTSIYHLTPHLLRRVSAPPLVATSSPRASPRRIAHGADLSSLHLVSATSTPPPIDAARRPAAPWADKLRIARGTAMSVRVGAHTTRETSHARRAPVAAFDASQEDAAMAAASAHGTFSRAFARDASWLQRAHSSSASSSARLVRPPVGRNSLASDVLPSLVQPPRLPSPPPPVHSFSVTTTARAHVNDALRGTLVAPRFIRRREEAEGGRQ